MHAGSTWEDWIHAAWEGGTGNRLIGETLETIVSKCLCSLEVDGRLESMACSCSIF